MNGDNPPDLKNIEILAKKLGPEIYDIMGIPRPERAIREAQATYENLPDNTRNEFLSELEKLIEKWRKRK